MAFLFRLETTDGVPADPPTLTSVVPNWSSGDTIPLAADCQRDGEGRASFAICTLFKSGAHRLRIVLLSSDR